MSDTEGDDPFEDIEKEKGFISELKESSSEYADLLGELRGGKDDLDMTNSELDFIVRPSADDVAAKAYEKVIEEVENPEQIPFEEPRPVLMEAERQMSLLRDDLVEEIERVMEMEEGSVTGADIDTMLYIIDKNAGKTGRFTLFGGAESLIHNLGEKFDWHPYETRLVLYANEIAARKNNLHRHLLLDQVVIIPNDESVVLD